MGAASLAAQTRTVNSAGMEAMMPMVLRPQLRRNGLEGMVG